MSRLNDWMWGRLWVAEIFESYGMKGRMFGLTVSRRVGIIRPSHTKGLFIKLPWRVSK